MTTNGDWFQENKDIVFGAIVLIVCLAYFFLR
jgi:hypothetical protein